MSHVFGNIPDSPFAPKNLSFKTISKFGCEREPYRIKGKELFIEKRYNSLIKKVIYFPSETKLFNTLPMESNYDNKKSMTCFLTEYPSLMDESKINKFKNICLETHSLLRIAEIENVKDFEGVNGVGLCDCFCCKQGIFCEKRIDTTCAHLDFDGYITWMKFTDPKIKIRKIVIYRPYSCVKAEYEICHFSQNLHSAFAENNFVHCSQVENLILANTKLL